MAEEAATVAVESKTGKDAGDVAALAANATLQAAAELGLKSYEAVSSLAIAAGSAASRAGENRFESIDEMADAAVAAVRKVTVGRWSPKEIMQAATLAAGMAVATSAIDTGKSLEDTWKSAVQHAMAVASQAQLSALDAAKASAMAAAFAVSRASPQLEGAKLVEAAKEVAAEAAKASGASSEQLADLSQSAATEVGYLKIPIAARQAAGIASKHATGGGKMSREKAVGEISIVAQLAGRAAQLAGMSSEETAVVMGLEVAEALPKFDAHDGPQPMAEDATLAALAAARTLGLTLKQLEAVTMHAAAGGAITAGQIFFLNVKEIAQLAVHAVLATSKGLAEEDAATLAAEAAGCAAAEAAAQAGASKARVQKAAAAAAQRAAAAMQLTPVMAARLAALSAGRAAGRSRATEKASSEEIRRSAAEAAVAIGKALELPSVDLVAAEAAQVSAAEAAAYAARGKKKPPPMPEPKKDFRNLDADNDGLVTAGELGKWEPENDFVEMEKNGDSEITMQEFQKWNPQHAKVVKKEPAESGAGTATDPVIVLAQEKTLNTFDLLDTDHDNKISPRELIAGRHVDTFSLLDTNHDGKLSAEELRRWRGATLGAATVV
ncbi:unnamed protein product [Cladocopium goreaui]|uniref:Hippocalcin-like protein 1 n=1 Tax=Cladocopium goreaui TaxID=2562237 RepID=A0A9P1C3T2_9DINO|nr:unnamed protein product [Cladocopium goreaui]